MRASGVFWVVFAACGLAGACGSDHKSTPHPAAMGGDGSPGGEPTISEAGAATGGSSTTPMGGDGSITAAGQATSGAGEPSSAGAPVEGGAGAAPGPETIELDVDASQKVHAISPLIYGANMDGLSCGDTKARFTFCRSRSAAWSTYDWENNASNAGSSDCNENNDALSASDTPAAAVTDLVDEADAADAATIVTLPMLDYVAADTNGGDAQCSGDVSLSADYLNTRFVQNRARKGSALSLTPDTGDAYVNQDELVNLLAQDYADSQLLFGLDSQPELWDQEHPKVHPTKATYADVVDACVEYGKMVKDTWPGAEVMGFSGYGYLAAHSLQESPDYDQDGEFFSYFLKQLKSASDTDGRRLLDYVDLHWFPEIYPNGDANRVVNEDTSEAFVKARVQAPRSLWDPSYVEGSWITDALGKKPIELISWLKGDIDDNYPGTKLAISEWAYGGGKHISGAIAAADALGIFGQQGVDLAGAVSFSPDDEPYLIGAFEAYRNYDGQGSSFGDTSVSATSSNVARGSIYASIDQSDPSRMVLVAINRYEFELDATVNIQTDASYTSLTPYVISAGQPDPKQGAAIDAATPNSFQLTLAPYSVWVLVPSE